MDAIDTSAGTLVAPLEWPWARSAAPLLSSDRSGWSTALIRRWKGTSAEMVQPPLDHHYVVMHFGGAKHVTRRRDGPTVASIAESGSITIVPAGTSYVWRTEGPIAFAHLYIRPDQLHDAAGRERGDDRTARLIESVACRDPLLEPLFTTMIDAIAASATPSRLLLDSLLESFNQRLVQRHSTIASSDGPRAVALAPHRLRRVIEFVDAHLGDDIGLADLVAAATTSQFHFSRAFRLALGCSPYRYLLRRRIDRACVLLLTSDESLESISRRCGFNSRHQFSLMFKRVVGTGPKRFRLEHCGPRKRAGPDVRPAAER